MASFPYMSQIYNMIPRPFRDYGEVYANAPKAAYEKKMADEEMQMKRDAAELQKQQVQTSIMDKHFNNALQLVKLAGPQAGMKYLNQYVPDHGISFEGFGTAGEFRFKSAKGNGGAGAAFSVGPNGSIWPEGTFGTDGHTLTPEGLKYYATLNPKQRAAFNAYQSQVKAMTPSKGPKKYQDITIIDETGSPQKITVDENGQPIRMNLLPTETTTTVTPTAVEGTVPARPMMKGKFTPFSAEESGPGLNKPVAAPPARRITDSMGPKPSGDSLANESFIPGALAAPDLYFGQMTKNAAEQARIKAEKEKRRQYQ